MAKRGRPPKGERAMTGAERIALHRQLARSAPPPEPQELAIPFPLAAQVRIEELTRQLDETLKERDQARADLYQARRERDEARQGIVPKFRQAGGHVRESWCMFCRRGQTQVDMIVATDLELRLGICFHCVERCNAIIAEKRVGASATT